MFRRILTSSVLRAISPPPQRPTTTTMEAAPRSLPAGDPTPDDFLAKLVKLLPTETVTAYVIIDGALRSVPGQVPLALFWISFVVLFALTYPYIKRRTAVPGLSPATLQTIVTTLGFAVWVFALGGPFAATWPDNYKPYYGTVLLALYSAAAPLVFK